MILLGSSLSSTNHKVPPASLTEGSASEETPVSRRNATLESSRLSNEHSTDRHGESGFHAAGGAVFCDENGDTACKQSANNPYLLDAYNACATVCPPKLAPDFGGITFKIWSLPLSAQESYS